MIIRLEEDQWKTLTDAEKSVITYINNNEEPVSYTRLTLPTTCSV